MFACLDLYWLNHLLSPCSSSPHPIRKKCCQRVRWLLSIIQGFSWNRGDPGLHHEFQVGLGYTMRTCLQNKEFHDRLSQPSILTVLLFTWYPLKTELSRPDGGPSVTIQQSPFRRLELRTYFNYSTHHIQSYMCMCRQSHCYGFSLYGNLSADIHVYSDTQNLLDAVLEYIMSGNSPVSYHGLITVF